MNILGLRLRQRRRQLGLRQKDLAGAGTASFLSKVESGTAQPSLANLTTWAAELNTTPGDLLGDHLVLEAAKQTILLTEKCLGYLELLHVSPLTTFLKELTISATSLSAPVPDPPRDPELEYLTATVLVQRGMLMEAKALTKKALATTHLYWKIRLLSLLYLIYEKLHEPDKKRQVQDDLKLVLNELDHDQLLHILPDAEALSMVDLDLLKLSTLLHYKGMT
ncbi:MAG: helix-turn-helix domain-containing protein [Firmicutes bacterium]|nr:helix-turn-helix domain-containing protein [Bacillota bacterium]